jgi:predicted RNA-binding protein YlqC (UPF0109 family)
MSDDKFDDDDNRVPGGRARAVLEYLAEQLVDDPDSIEVDARTWRHRVSLSLSVAPDDMGRVIGRRGRTAQAVRTVVRAAGARDGLDAYVDIVD